VRNIGLSRYGCSAIALLAGTIIPSSENDAWMRSDCSPLTSPMLLQVTSSVWLAAVEALRNFALIKSARLHMLKEGWLTQCAVLLASIRTAERIREQSAAVALVEFLANFTFSADGQVRHVSPTSVWRLHVLHLKVSRSALFCLQVGCLKVSGMLSGIVGALACNRVDAQRAASLAIRNMCFHRE
jgi:hypothetical protein